ncbi:phosphatidylglycerophosphatase A [Methanonatronarchaeum thermophilum]|nr:phosphatidylglycerophosphatase A [Methanonatronarchaeum thermophilum]
MKFNSYKNYLEITGSFKVLSSAPLNGGFCECNKIVNINVDGSQCSNDKPISDSFTEILDLNETNLDSIVGFMTGADVSKFYQGSADIDIGTVHIWITAGIGSSLEKDTNTINIILVTDINLSQTAMANLFIVITEAKSNALRYLEITHDGDLITGTPTDAIAVAKNSKKGDIVKYSGVATPLGKTVYSLVEKGVIEALEKQEGYSVNRPILHKLKEKEIKIEDMTEAAFSLYEGGQYSETEKKAFQNLLKQKCKDENIKSLIESGMYLGRRAKIQNKKDQAYIVADELIGMEIAQYIGGRNALFNFVRYDKEKPGILKKLDNNDIFLDDVIGGLIAGCMTRVYEQK